MGPGPQQLRASILCVPLEVSRRVRRICARGTFKQAQALLGISAHTLGAAREQGRMERKTYARLLETLERVEGL